MKVKIGNKIYDSSKEPIMVILSDQEKNNIANMSPRDHRYCCAADVTAEELKKFMKMA